MPKNFLWLASVTATLLVAACNGAPSHNVLGSYFPSWMLCAFSGVGGAILTKRGLAALDVDKHLPAPLLIYLILAVALAFVVWIIWLD